MRKEIYLVRGITGENHMQFKTRILALAKEAAGEERPLSLRLTITEGPPPFLSVIPFKKTKIAAISIYRESNSPIEKLTKAEGFSGAFLVEEAIPVGYERTWKNGEPTPGACLLTLFHRKPGLDYNTFLKRWHKGHTPLSLKIHPLWNYNRNVVKEKMTGHPQWFDGIVEEQTRTRAALINPFKFFGKPSKVIQNMMAVYRDTKSFLDFRRIETFLAVEYHIM